MSRTKKGKLGGGRIDKERKKDKKEKTREKTTKEAAWSLLADDTVTNPTLSSLFAAKPTPPERNVPAPAEPESDLAEEDDEVLSEIDVDRDDADQTIANKKDLRDEEAEAITEEAAPPKRRRKRKHDEDEVEDVYMRKLAREEAKEAEIAAAAQRVLKRQKTTDEDPDAALLDKSDADESDSHPDDQKDDDVAIIPSQDTAQDEDEDARELSPPPKHETEEAPDIELSKANSTVFLGNVSTAAISSKSARKTLDKHLQSFFPAIAPPKAGDPKHAVISLRFRSTPYAPTIPKKAAFATKQLMDATTKSTNAYAIYSSPTLAREAVKHLNGSIVLDRHLRVDSIAHPSKVDNRRCVFVGNLGFVDDESNIQAANAEEGKEHRKPAKHPSDVEEGLWRTFGKCGVVESVRVIRDGTTRVGKGIAYVQFEDEVAVEEALGLDGKKFPPLLPRKLRVSRAKAVKRNVGAGSGRPTTRAAGTGYKRKITGEEASKIGRTGRLFGRAAAAQVKKGSGYDARRSLAASDGIKKPEAFVFEGHRAKSGGGKSGLKLGGRKKKGGKVTGRSTAYKAKSKATAK